MILLRSVVGEKLGMWYGRFRGDVGGVGGGVDVVVDNLDGVEQLSDDDDDADADCRSRREVAVVSN